MQNCVKSTKETIDKKISNELADGKLLRQKIHKARHRRYTYGKTSAFGGFMKLHFLKNSLFYLNHRTIRLLFLFTIVFLIIGSTVYCVSTPKTSVDTVQKTVIEEEGKETKSRNTFESQTTAPQDKSPEPSQEGAAIEIRRNNVVVTTNIIEISKDGITGVCPQGDFFFKMKPGIKVPLHYKTGDTVLLHCAVQKQGSLEVEKVAIHKGLGVWFGTVSYFTPNKIKISNSIAEKEFIVDQHSDVPEGVQRGSFVGLKFYEMDDSLVMLNCLIHQGKIAHTGVIRNVGKEQFYLKTLTMDLALPIKNEFESLIQPRTAVNVSYNLDKKSEIINLTLSKKEDEFTFIGKLYDYNKNKNTVVIIDTHGNLLGSIPFRIDKEWDLLNELKPGDLIEVTYAYDVNNLDRLPLIIDMKQRQLSPVYFGEILQIDDKHVKLITRQKQRKELKITSNTKIPKPIVRGNFANVIYKDKGEGIKPEALVIVKE